MSRPLAALIAGLGLLSAAFLPMATYSGPDLPALENPNSRLRTQLQDQSKAPVPSQWVYDDPAVRRLHA
ncbi:hypothetical protein FHS85_001164 [Rhodoligotrophos appendicifer]|uniref:hypothetical protein n=1 Tax=Rhodoligotrophos appendicifer TaxID=987056 RepID=UPI001184FBE2|nr:hypothetical protein [Rhodoligotrophos appendicifer]